MKTHLSMNLELKSYDCKSLKIFSYLPVLHMINRFDGAQNTPFNHALKANQEIFF